MSTADLPEPCPTCGSSESLRRKLLLIDEAWKPAPGKDSRLKYFADLRADDLKQDLVRKPPLEQFVDGYFCDRCGKGFVSEETLAATHRRYR